MGCIGRMWSRKDSYVNGARSEVGEKSSLEKHTHTNSNRVDGWEKGIDLYNIAPFLPHTFTNNLHENSGDVI